MAHNVYTHTRVHMRILLAVNLTLTYCVVVRVNIRSCQWVYIFYCFSHPLPPANL